VDAYKESARAKIAAGAARTPSATPPPRPRLAENDPDAARAVQEATVAKALSYVAQNQAALAIQDLTALRDKSPDLAIARVGLGRAYAANRQVDLAIVELQKAVELDPASAEAQYQLGYTQHMLKRDAAAAVGPYSKAVAAEPGNVDYRTQLGAALAAANQPDRAVEELTKVTSSPGYQKADAWIYLGQAQLGAKKYKDASPPSTRRRRWRPTTSRSRPSWPGRTSASRTPRTSSTTGARRRRWDRRSRRCSAT
jgi:tetratricopeptide (TPR) repeat protein